MQTLSDGPKGKVRASFHWLLSWDLSPRDGEGSLLSYMRNAVLATNTFEKQVSWKGSLLLSWETGHKQAWWALVEVCDNGHSELCQCYWLMLLTHVFSHIQHWNKKCLPQRVPRERMEDPLVKYNLSLKEIEMTRWILKGGLFLFRKTCFGRFQWMK